MRHLTLVVAFALAAAAQAPAQYAAGESAPDEPTEAARKLTPDEERVFKLALAYAETKEQGLNYHLVSFALTARDPATKVQTIMVCGTPKKGSKWRCASVTFKVFVDPDGRVSEPQWQMRCCW